MAEIYKGVHGKLIQDWLSELDIVHEAIVEHTEIIADRARILKAGHVDTGASTVDTDFGSGGDGWIYLDDTRGKKAAMSMEFGSGPNDGPFPDGTAAQAILHHAAGIPIKHTHPRSKRKKRYYKSKKRRRR